MRTTILTLAIILLTSAHALGQKPDKCENRPDNEFCGSISPSSATGPTTSPIEPREPNDTRFIENGGAGLDTGCTYRPGGPLVISVPVKRVVGPTTSNGTLQFPQQMIASGMISPTVTLRMPAYDVDVAGAPGFPPEVDTVLFNGTNIGTLSGSNNTWKLNEFEIPLELVRFGTRGANGSEPTPGNNQITILIDQASGSAVNWCTAIDWVELSFKTVSPIILIPGNGMSNTFYVERGFVSHLDSRRLVYDHSIATPKEYIYPNAKRLDEQIPGIVKSFGVDSVHLVTHSKGGLDARAYLEVYQPARNKDFKILSLNTLGTPHEGTVLTDLQEARETAINTVGRVEFEGFPTLTGVFSALAEFDNGRRSLTTRYVGAFNTVNLRALPPDVVINTLGADADFNNNGQIDRFPDEYAELRPYSPHLAFLETNTQNLNPARYIVDTLYKIILNTRRIELECCRTKFTITGPRRVATVRAIPSGGGVLNDTLVSAGSANGHDSILPLSTNNEFWVGTIGRNHTRLGDAGVAVKIVSWIFEVEQSSGDLR